MKVILKDEYKSFIRVLQETDKQMNQFVQYISLLDVIINKAFIAIENNYCRPFICDDREKSFLDAVQLRHPLIEKLQKNETYVPNDLYIGCKKQDGVLLYGTNAAGKTSFIRSMGIAVIMAQAGCFVAATEFHYKPYNAIFTRILGNDNLFKGLSTFQVEMCELNTILKQADENSLILGDELCSGTEINSAIALVTSGIEELNDIKASYIFATHLHKLTKLDEILSIERLVFKHMSVIYEKSTDELIWTRILENGSGNDMYGLEVCKSLQMPAKFLERAFKLRLKLLPEKQGTLTMKKSRYNANKLKGKCELCDASGVDIHHLMPQEMADNKGFIDHIHKNHPANIVNICKACHLKETKNKTYRRKVKTCNGMKLMVC
jgi:DNA mismatch repair protein MutS